MFAKLFGLTKKNTDGFRVQLKIPTRWDTRKKFPDEGRYPNAVLAFRPGMSETECAALLTASGATQNLKDVFWSPTAQAIRVTFDDARVLREIFFGASILDDVTVHGVTLRSPLAGVLEVFPDFKSYTPDFMLNNTMFIPTGFSYYKTTIDDVDVELVVKNDRVHGVGLRSKA
jgi:hypothetical protein